MDANNLPKGWTVKTVKRQTGKTKGATYKYYVAPDGTKLRSIAEVKKYRATNEY